MHKIRCTYTHKTIISYYLKNFTFDLIPIKATSETNMENIKNVVGNAGTFLTRAVQVRNNNNWVDNWHWCAYYNYFPKCLKYFNLAWFKGTRGLLYGQNLGHVNGSPSCLPLQIILMPQSFIKLKMQECARLVIHAILNYMIQLLHNTIHKYVQIMLFAQLCMHRVAMLYYFFSLTVI